MPPHLPTTTLLPSDGISRRTRYTTPQPHGRLPAASSGTPPPPRRRHLPILLLIRRAAHLTSALLPTCTHRALPPTHHAASHGLPTCATSLGSPPAATTLPACSLTAQHTPPTCLHCCMASPCFFCCLTSWPFGLNHRWRRMNMRWQQQFSNQAAYLPEHHSPATTTSLLDRRHQHSLLYRAAHHLPFLPASISRLPLTCLPASHVPPLPPL